MFGEGSSLSGLSAWICGTGPPRLEKVRSLREVKRRGIGAHGPPGGSQGHDAKFLSGGTWPSCGSGIDNWGEGGGDWRESTFCFRIHVTSGFNVFSTVILTRSWWRRTLICNPKPSNPRRYPHTKFQENRTKTVAVTVPPFYLPRWPPWRHQLC